MIRPRTAFGNEILRFLHTKSPVLGYEILVVAILVRNCRFWARNFSFPGRNWNYFLVVTKFYHFDFGSGAEIPKNTKFRDFITGSKLQNFVTRSKIQIFVTTSIITKSCSKIQNSLPKIQNSSLKFKKVFLEKKKSTQKTKNQNSIPNCDPKPQKCCSKNAF